MLVRMTDYEAMARWPEPEFTFRQFSSYDRGTVAPDQPGWFANDDHTKYLRTEETEGRKEQVMMDADGPGCIVRFWLTTIQNKRGTLRIYLDGQATPALTFPAYDLLAGDLKLGEPLLLAHPGYSPADNGGNTLRLPIPYAKHCKVTWEEAGQGPRYYQIDALTFAPGTEVKTFTREMLEAERGRIAETGKALMSPRAAESGPPLALDRMLEAGKSAMLELPAGPRAVRQVELKVSGGDPAQMERTLRSTIVQMRCDGEDTVWCPVSDFFGSGVGVNELHNWYRTVLPDGTMSCRWVMPYEKAAQIALVNVGDGPVKVALRVNTAPWKWDERSMHFHSVWHDETGLATPPYRDWNYVKIAGRGIYIGDTLSLFNPVATWYGEGDEKISVDGEAFPSDMGTGTEDYYDYSFAPKGLMQTPFANQVRVDQPMTQGHNVLTRTRNLDAMPFRKALNFDIELMSWKPTTLTYAATTYWYAFPGATSNVAPQPREAALPVPTLAEAIAASAPKRRPGAVECEGLKVTAKSKDFSVRDQTMEAFGEERWSGGAQLLAVPEGPGDFVEIAVPAPDAFKKRLVLYATQAPDYGTLRFAVNGQKVVATFDGYAPGVQPGAAFDLGVFAPKNGSFTFRVEVAGSNPAAHGKCLLGLDCILMEKP
jgi:hypothetical protein